MELNELKPAIARRKKVKYNGNKYYVNAGTIRVKDGAWVYEVELKDPKANSIVIASMEKCEVLENGKV